MRTTRIGGADFRRLRSAWPRLCCGCGLPPTTAHRAFIRRQTLAQKVLGLLGHAHWTTYELDLPCCRRCAIKLHAGPIVWALGCSAAFVIALASMELAAPYDPAGNRREGLARLPGLAIAATLMLSILLGPPLYFVFKRFFAPAVIVDFGGPWADLEWIDITFGNPSFVSALELTGAPRAGQ